MGSKKDIDPLVSEARKRQTYFKELPKYLAIIKDAVRKKVDSQAKIFLFGSVAEGTNVYSSDIDILVVSDKKPEEIRVALWDAGIEEPFEVLIIPPRSLPGFRTRAKLVPV
jgi:predicted nucleotidyltransferase